MRFFRGFRKQYRWMLANAFSKFGFVLRENTPNRSKRSSSDGFRNYWFETGGISTPLIFYFNKKPRNSPCVSVGMDSVITGLNRMFLVLDHVRYPVVDEAACRGYLQAMLCGTGVYARVEVHNALERSDLEVDAGNRRWIFELEYLAASASKNETLKTQLLAEAVKQTRLRRYGEQVISSRKLVRIAAVFSATKRQIVCWTTVPLQS